MAIHNKSHFNHGLMSINGRNAKTELKHMTASDFDRPRSPMVVLNVADCFEFLRQIPDNSIQLICLDPPYNLELAGWDSFDNYIDWAAEWLEEAYRVLAPSGNLVIFGGMQFRDEKSGDLIDIIHHVRTSTKFKLINTIIWYYKNGMSAKRYFANRHEEAIWLVKTNNYYFDLDSVRVPYSEKELQLALKDKRLNPENTVKGKNPTNVWEIGRLNGNSKQRVGHPTQKPVEIIERFVRALSYPGSTVLDFFAGSGTVGRVCISEGRNCLMCDSDKMSNEYFARHLDQMKVCGTAPSYSRINSVEEFFLKLDKCGE